MTIHTKNRLVTSFDIKMEPIIADLAMGQR